MQEKHSHLIRILVEELALPLSGIQTVIELLEGGNTIPFIARYRKEGTGNLDEVQIKAIQDRYEYLKELEERRKTILTSIESQGKLTDELRSLIVNCQTKALLEDLYLPFKPKRRTRAMIAREKGLEPLAQLILQRLLDHELVREASAYIDAQKGVVDVESALAGARDIVAEKIAENVDVRAAVREAYATEGFVVSKARPEKTGEPTKFEQYYDYKESVRTIPSHRYLAIRRGEREEILDFTLQIESAAIIYKIKAILGCEIKSTNHGYFQQAIEDAFARLLCPSVETDVRLELKEISDRSAVAVFADNIKHLLLASPLGARPVVGIDPGIRTGCKCAVVDATGKFLEACTIFPAGSEKALLQAKESLAGLIERYHPYALAIGNGTAGRETEAFVRRFLKEIHCETVIVVSVNEAGASVYSASDVAREEFPEVDITIRGAISIARRLQDPLAELVKIDPKSIGVGQYQHDVHQPLLQQELQHVVESCVNQVGVDVNTASPSLLSYVSGIGPSLASKVIKHRETSGAFHSRKELRNISGFGAKTFEQAAGFLRIPNGENPLDASAVHPERYELVEQMAKDLNIPLKQLVNNPGLVDKIDRKRYLHFAGELTLADIIQELKKPGRDPRASFEPPAFREDVLSIEDLKLGMRLDGIVTNVTAFGAFVDIGVHQDGLVHLSELSETFIKHPAEAVKTGDKIKVEVLLIDIPRKRISLTARIGENRKSLQTPIHQKGSREKSKQMPPKANFSSNPFSSL